MEMQFVSAEVRKRRERDTARYSQILFDWSEVDKALSFFLERLKDGSSLGPQLRDDVCTIKLMMKILIPLLGHISMLQNGDLVSKHSLNSMASVLEHVIEELEAFGGQSLPISEAGDLNSYSTTAAGIVTSNLVRLRNMKPEMRKLLFHISGSSKPLAEGGAAQLVNFVNLLLDILNDMLCCRDDLVKFLKERIEALQNQLIFLRNIIGFLSEICFRLVFLRDLLSFAGAQVVIVVCILYFILVDKISEDRAQKIKTKLLFVVEKKIKPLSQNSVNRSIYVKALEASRRSRMKVPIVIGVHALGFFDSLIHNLRELSNKRVYFEVASEELIESLLERLMSIRCYVEGTPSDNYEEGLDNFMTQLLDLIIDFGCFVCGLESKEKLGDLLDKIQFIESASGDLLIPRSWQYNFPKTNELGFVDFILVNLWERLNCSMISPDLWNCSIDTIYEELVSLRHDFGEIAWLCKENEEFRSLLIHYKDVTYQAEYLFDLSLSATEFSAYQRLGLTGLMESIWQINRKLKAITVEMTSDNLVHNILDSVSCLSPEANPASISASKLSRNEAGSHIDKATDQLVGLEYDIEKIKWQLMRGSKQLQILSIVGMPGIGKTTLATSVYEDPAVTMHFHARVWCSVSQAYQKESLLNEILHQVQRETKQDLEDNDKGFDLQVYQGLKGRRYLVILDDIWEAKVWADLKLCFPDDSNGSRVVFTTRNHDVAIQANSDPHALQLLSEEESWKLLRVKVFKEETCPVELSQVGKKITKDCRGLPLSVVLIAGVLKTTERKQDCWERIAEKLRTYVLDYASGEQLGAIELSYVHLSDYLKPCFLYFGALPEDTEIPVRKLVHLWVAEGFIQQPKGDQISPENVAENYLNSLIRRSLLIIAKRSSRGGVKACRIHDLLRDFCLVKSKEERFLLQIKRYDDFPAFRIPEMHEQYRLCIDSPSIPSARMGHFESRVRTLFLSRWRHFSPGSFSRPKYHDYLKGIDVLDKFRLLRVLDLGKVTIRDEEDFVTITRLVYLRYLAIRAYYIREIPAGMANLKNLETFLLTAAPSIDVSPETIWSMANLRHLHIRISGDFMSCFNFLIDTPKLLERLWPLESLTTLSTPALRCDKRIEKMMLNLPNLQKLKCIFYDSWDPSGSCIHFPAFDFLNRLEMLSVFFIRKQNPSNLCFPPSLKKLTISGSCLPWDEISIIGRLPNLEVLKLLDGAFRGYEWDMKDGEFQELKFLKLDSLDIARWNAFSEHLPCLEQLVLENCCRLKQIPSILGEITTLRRIDMKLCSPSAVHAVKQIQTEQHEMGNDQFQLHL